MGNVASMLVKRCGALLWLKCMKMSGKQFPVIVIIQRRIIYLFAIMHVLTNEHYLFFNPKRDV